MLRSVVEIQKGPADPRRAARFTALSKDVDAAVKRQDIASAVNLSEQAIREGFAHPVFFQLLAYRDTRTGRSREAIALLRNGLTVAPKDVNLLNLLGYAHATLGEHQEAIAVYGQAAATVKDFPPLYYNRGISREALGDIEGARADYDKAVALQPTYVEALSRLAYAEMLRGQARKAREYADRALSLDPSDQMSAIAMAMADISEQSFDAAEARITILLREPRLTEVNRSAALGLLADAYDGQGRTESAFDAYSQSGDVLHRFYADVFANNRAYAVAENLRQQIEAHPAWPADRVPAAEKDHCRAHVFLVGFPRSGTTLLEQALAGHPDVVTSEERDFLIDTEQTFLSDSNGISRFLGLPGDALARSRDLYWERVAEAGLKPAGKVFIDKLPLNSILLPFIARLFPDAKIVFALRDPRDVVFSCFRRRFALNSQMYELTTLASAAAYYSLVMQLRELYRRKLPLDWEDVRYEDIAADLKRGVAPILGHIGVQWHDAMQDFAARTKKRAVDTPSGMQLARGLTEESVGSWKPYREQLAVVRPELEPWVQRFGYGES